MFFFVALILLLLLPSPWNFVGFIGGLMVFVGEVLFWNRKVRTGRKTVGAQTLIGKEATVVSPCRPSGQVRIAGEIWAARCSSGADTGETVTVVGLDELTLLVDLHLPSKPTRVTEPSPLTDSNRRPPPYQSGSSLV